MKLPRERSRRRGRIEIIPMIDVMFFLLATFMLASLSMQNLHSMPVDLPKCSGSRTETPRLANIRLFGLAFTDNEPLFWLTLDANGFMLSDKGSQTASSAHDR